MDYLSERGEGDPISKGEIRNALRKCFTRNPMLVGVYIYDIGVLLWLQSWWPLAVFAVEVALLALQVRSEEKRLEADFGDAYRAYRQKVPRYLLK